MSQIDKTRHEAAILLCSGWSQDCFSTCKRVQVDAILVNTGLVSTYARV